MPVMFGDIDYVFDSHPPETEAQIEGYRAIRAAGKALAETILNHSPICADQTAAVRHVRDAVMTANAAIALKGLV